MPIIQGGSLHTGLGTFYDNMSSSTNNNATVYTGSTTYTGGTAGSEQTSLSIALTDYRREYWYVKGGKGSQNGNWYINIEHEGQKLAYGTGNKDNSQWYDQGKENLGAGTFKILSYTANNKFTTTWRVTTMDLDQGENLSGRILSTGVSNINFGSSYANVNTTAYKWVLPVAGTYMISASLRARIWSDDGFGKIRLYNSGGKCSS